MSLLSGSGLTVEGGGAEREKKEERHILLQGQTLGRTRERLTTLANIARARLSPERTLVLVDLGCAFGLHLCSTPVLLTSLFDKLALNRIAAQLSANLMATVQPQD